MNQKETELFRYVVKPAINSIYYSGMVGCAIGGGALILSSIILVGSSIRSRVFGNSDAYIINFFPLRFLYENKRYANGAMLLGALYGLYKNN